jgi:hypothetical protein
MGACSGIVSIRFNQRDQICFNLIHEVILRFSSWFEPCCGWIVGIGLRLTGYYGRCFRVSGPAQSPGLA